MDAVAVGDARRAPAAESVAGPVPPGAAACSNGQQLWATSAACKIARYSLCRIRTCF
jgi:hypothetical protein